jgi:hypothetical protein
VTRDEGLAENVVELIHQAAHVCDPVSASVGRSARHALTSCSFGPAKRVSVDLNDGLIVRFR